VGLSGALGGVLVEGAGAGPGGLKPGEFESLVYGRSGAGPSVIEGRGQKKSVIGP
jgi:hypothetical protein